jgi:N-methylhydantoinase A/oxoprolinase/acetone carboxylase beta subunit
VTAAPVFVGIDTGGTFTDLIASVGGELRAHKVLSTPANPADAVLRGLREILPEAPPALITYGSTVATNALLERRGARVVLLTTAGFEDVIEIGRQNRPALYDPEPAPAQPLVPRSRRIGIDERMLHDGKALLRPTPAKIAAALLAARRHAPQAVAVCLLHAYANPAHERMLGRAARRAQLACSLSHELVSEHREYERLSTTVVNAYVAPVMTQHLRHLERRLRRTKLRVMQSNGGAISARLAGREAVRTVLSGPAGGVMGGWAVARALRLRRIITFDMGGTSTDVSLLDGGPTYRTEWSIGGSPLKVPALDIHTVGAGGGSMARIDAGGALKVGPESAGADPGPACYGRGAAATVTDANVVLGRLVTGQFLDGRMRLHPDRAEKALASLGGPLRGAAAAAEGVVRVVNAGMERAIRAISVERGHDPREYALVAFGGAAGQHACELAAALGIRNIVVPRHPGLLSAWGGATADVQRDYVHTVRQTNPSFAGLRRGFAPLVQKARAELRREGMKVKECDISLSADVRYQGQSYEINVPFGPRMADEFHHAHERLYGYADRERSLEVVNLRVAATGAGPRLPASRFKPTATLQRDRQRTRWQGRWLQAALYLRPQIPAGRRIRGPALIAELSATTFVAPGWSATVHRTGHILLIDNGQRKPGPGH